MKKPEILSVYSQALAVVCMALSVSLTHIFIFFSFIFFSVSAAIQLFSFLKTKLPAKIDLFSSDRIFTSSDMNLSSKEILNTDKDLKYHKTSASPDRFHFLKTPFFPGSVIFAALFISGIIHNGIFQTDWILKSEMNDFALYLFGVLVYFTASNSRKNREILLTAFEIFIILLFMSGLIAAFSEFRLAKIIMMHDLVPSAGNRPQHPFLNIAGIQLYQPIGFMNTRLTYAGLLILSLPYSFVKTFSKNGLAGAGRTLSIAVFAAGLLVLFMNHSRSAQMGITAAAVLSILSPLYRSLLLQYKKYFAAAALIFFFAGASAGIYAVISPGIARKAESKILRYTDHQRPIIWKGSFEIFKKSPLTGAGPGNFTKETLDFRKKFAAEYPELLYFTSNTPSGHAHNDFLHLLATGGSAAGIFFLLFVFSFSKYLAAVPENISGVAEFSDLYPHLFLSTGLLAIALAGLAQCYFQDDEVSAAVWSAAALLSASENSGRRILPSD